MSIDTITGLPIDSKVFTKTGFVVAVVDITLYTGTQVFILYIIFQLLKTIMEIMSNQPHLSK